MKEMRFSYRMKKRSGNDDDDEANGEKTRVVRKLIE